MQLENKRARQIVLAKKWDIVRHKREEHLQYRQTLLAKIFFAS
jgi:hypothetical protein